jgi:hypothetical protein
MAGAIGGLTIGLGPQAFAQSTTEQIRAQQAQIDYMKHQIELMQQKLQDLQTTTKATEQATQQQQVATAAALAKVTPPKGKKGIQIGAVTLTPGGFLDADGLYRSRNLTSDINTKFNSIPFGNSPNSSVDENRFSARQSRLALLATSDVNSSTHLSGYYEMDFQGASTTANSNQSNSYIPRIRNIYATIDWDDIGLHLLAGQSWSLATLQSKGISPRNEVTPIGIDTAYIVGFDYTRAPGFRITQDLLDKTLWLAASVENPQTTTSGTAPSGNGTLVSNTGGSLFDTGTSYSIDAAPDVIVKAAWEPGFGHYEVYGIASFPRDRVSGTNHTSLDGGVGFGANLPVIPTYVDFQISGLVGQGVGRYAAGQLPDATFGANGVIHPVTAYSLLTGVVGHPAPDLDIYGYAGIEHADRWYQNVKVGATTTLYGYGDPLANNTGCNIQATASVCTANTRDLMEVSGGFWWKFYQGDFGSARWGAQYEYVARNVWPGKGGGGTTDENVIMTAFRFYPF